MTPQRLLPQECSCWALPREMHNRSDVIGLGEQIHQVHLLQDIARLQEGVKTTRQCRRITGDVSEADWSESRKLARDFGSQAHARRMNNNYIQILGRSHPVEIRRACDATTPTIVH